MASKGQKFASYSLEFKNEVLEAYKSGKYGGRDQVAKHYNISSATIWNWISISNYTQSTYVCQVFNIACKLIIYII